MVVILAGYEEPRQQGPLGLRGLLVTDARRPLVRRELNGLSHGRPAAWAARVPRPADPLGWIAPNEETKAGTHEVSK